LAAGCFASACSDDADAEPPVSDATVAADSAKLADTALDSTGDAAVAPDTAQPDSILPDSTLLDSTQSPDSKGDIAADSKADAASDADSTSAKDTAAEVDSSSDSVADTSACAKAVLTSAVVQNRNLQLKASPTTASGKPVTSYAWSIGVPLAGGKLSPDATSAAVTFGPLVYRGAYEACLQVTAAGEKSCGATCQILTYEPDLYLELTWLSPGAPDPTGAESSDLNLHLVQGASASGKDLDCDGAPDPWYDDKVSVYWFNETPDWGAAGLSADNPYVDDAANAAKPEVIAIELPQDGTYTVAVHALSDKGVGASVANLTVYYKGKILSQQAGISLAQSDLWTAGAITLAGGTASFNSCHQSGDACKSGKLWQSTGDICLTPCFEYKGLFTVPTLGCAWKWP
jgi:hypothetical protein